MICPRKEYFCYAVECDCPMDGDTQFDLHKEAIAAREVEQSVRTQGSLDIILNGSHIGTIDPNTGTIYGLPDSLDFAQFEYINNILQAITPKTL